MSKHFPLDIHTHSLASGHAYGTIREMAQAASEKGLEALGITEHSPGIPGTCHPIYFSNLKAVPRVLYGVNMRHGSEVNIMNDGTIDLPEKYCRRLDYLIAGIHGLCYTDEGREKNTDNVIACMKHPKVHFISHPDDDHTPLDYKRLVLAALENEVALEVNNSSLRKPQVRLNCVENYKTMLKYCMEYRCPIVVDSDAHDPSAVADHQLAYALLEEVGFDMDLVVNTSLEKFDTFIHFGA